MEFTKDITFSGGLKSKGTTTITYSGGLYKSGSESVSIVYGFGENWDYTSEKEMKKTEGGFSVEVEMKDGFDTFNFCFRNGNFEWDNNQTFNYISAIEQTVGEEIPEVQDFFEEDTNFDTDFLIEILDSLFEETFNKTETLDTNKQQILDDILSENIATSEEAINLVEDFDMNELVENILNPVVNCVISEDSKFDTVSVPVVKAEKVPDFTVLADTTEDVIENTTVDVDSKETSTESSALIPVSEDVFLVSPRKLRKFHFVIKKIKLAIYKLFVAIPKILNGSFNEDKN